MKKVAFITTEFLSEDSTQGGIGNYIYKMSSALKDRGHTPEIFVTSLLNNDEVYYDGIKVYRVFVNYFILRALRKIARLINLHKYYKILEDLVNSLLVFRKFKTVSARTGYDIVQTPNYRYPGLWISNNNSYCHYHRVSSNRILFDLAGQGEIKTRQKIINWIEIQCARRADIVYAPSKYLADYLNKEYELDVKVVRPPAHIAHSTTETNSFVNNGLPSRYLLHYGSLGRRKGTDIVDQALKIAWKKEPEMKMVFVGDLGDKFAYMLDSDYWGEYKNNVKFLGRVEKDSVYEIVEKAIAAVLPSRSDNLPNTVIESLCLNTPVIGTYNSSIEEIVQHGKTGMLVSQDDIDGLSDVMVKVWNNDIVFDRESISSNQLLEPLDVDTAVNNFISLGEYR